MNFAYLKFKTKDGIRKVLKSTFIIKCLSFVICAYAMFAGKTTKWTLKGVDEFIKTPMSFLSAGIPEQL